MKSLSIYCDGAARGNPGPAGAGAVLLNEDGSIVSEISEYLGETTNNQAEYRALILAIEEAIKHKAASLIIFMDSELAVNQIKGTYRVKNDGLKELFKMVSQKLKSFESFTIKHIPREQNKEADRLANRAIDEHDL